MTATNRNATTTVRPDSTAYAQSELDLIFTRTIHARRALVWKAYTDPKLISGIAVVGSQGVPPIRFA